MKYNRSEVCQVGKIVKSWIHGQNKTKYSQRYNRLYSNTYYLMFWLHESVSQGRVCSDEPGGSPLCRPLRITLDTHYIKSSRVVSFRLLRHPRRVYMSTPERKY